MKRILSRMLVSLTLVVTMIATMIPTIAFADEEWSTKTGEDGEYSITVINEPDTGITITGDWFHAYQILVADNLTTYAVHEDFEGFFVGVMYGADNSKFDFDAAKEAIADAKTVVDEANTGVTESTELEKLYADDVTVQAKIDDYNQLVGQYLETFQSGDPYELVVALRAYVTVNDAGDLISCIAHDKAELNADGSESVTLKGLTEGYYFVIDEESTLAGVGVASSGALVPVGSAISSTGSVTVYVKNSVPVVDKSILHNDLSGVVQTPGESGTDTHSGQWDIVGDYEIGDTAYFMITSTLPTNIEDYNFGYEGSTSYEDDSVYEYDDYYYVLTDEMSDGITYQEDAKVYVDKNGSEELNSTYYKVTHKTGEEGNGFEIQVNVKAVMNDTAYSTVGSLYTHYTGVVNEAAAVSSDYEDNTITLKFNSNTSVEDYYGEDSATVYSYTFDLEINKMDESGAALAGATFGIYDGSTWIPVQFLETDDGVDYYYFDPDMEIDDENTGYIVTSETGKFNIYGLDDATEYVLKEESAPDGYNAIDPISFMIEATYDSVTGKINTLTDNSASIGNSSDQSGFYADIINRKTVILPSTGGIGTVIFQVGGALLMLCAALYLILGMKKKSKKES